METNKSSSGKPTANLTIKKNRQKVHAVNGEQTLYMKDQTDFEIELQNNHTGRVGVKIYLNDTDVNGGQLVILNPGEHGFIDRFISSNNKMTFSTYNIDANNKDAVSATKNNGKVRIEFFREFFATYNNSIGTVNVQQVTPPWTINSPNTIQSPSPFYWGDTSTNAVNVPGTYTTGSVVVSCNNLTHGTISASPSVSCMNTFNSTASDTSVSVKETGIVNKGTKSGQVFSETFFQPEYFAFEKVEYRILPDSLKQVGINDKDKQYCTGCGYRVRDENWKFCPKCGTKTL